MLSQFPVLGSPYRPLTIGHTNTQVLDRGSANLLSPFRSEQLV